MSGNREGFAARIALAERYASPRSGAAKASRWLWRADGRLCSGSLRGGLGICEGFLLNKLNGSVIAVFGWVCE